MSLNEGWQIRGRVRSTARLWVMVWLVLGVALAACSPSSDNAESSLGPGDDVGEYCAPLAEHVLEICQASLGSFAAYTGAEIRKRCRAFPDPRERNCVLGMDACDEASFSTCGAANTTIVCDAADDCPGDLWCDLSLQECVECLDASACDEGDACHTGLCIPEEHVIAL